MGHALSRSSSSPRTPRWRGRRRPLIVIASVGVVALAAAVPTAAAFSAQVKATATVSAGTVKISVNGHDGADGQPVALPVSLPNPWTPGDTATAPLVVKNLGTLPVTIDLALAGEGTADSLGNVIDAVLAGPGIDNAQQGTGHAEHLTATLGGPLEPGETGTFTVGLTLPLDIDDTWQGKGDQLTVVVTGNQLLPTASDAPTTAGE